MRFVWVGVFVLVLRALFSGLLAGVVLVLVAGVVVLVLVAAWLAMSKRASRQTVASSTRRGSWLNDDAATMLSQLQAAKQEALTSQQSKTTKRKT